VRDLALFAENWLSGAGSVADIWPTTTGDGKVDMADFSVLGKYWMN
jgi:hypothetical protein